MTTFVALLRAINVGGTGMLPMKDLAALCTGLKLQNVRTYIQSGNIVFESPFSEEKIRIQLERALAEKMGKKMDVFVRTAAELRAVLECNPFPEAKPAQVAVVFRHDAPSKRLLDSLDIPGREELRPGTREIYIHYPDGMGRSRLKLPPDGPATVRNINTVARLVAMMGV